MGERRRPGSNYLPSGGIPAHSSLELCSWSCRDRCRLSPSGSQLLEVGTRMEMLQLHGAVRHEGVPTSEQRRSPALRSRAPSPAAAASHIAFSTLPVAVVVAPARTARTSRAAHLRARRLRPGSGSGRWRRRRRASGPSWRRGRPCLRALAAIGTGCRFRESSGTEGRWAGGAVRRHQIFPTATPHHPTVPRRLPEAVLVVSAQMKAHAQVWCGLGAGWCRLVQVGGHPWVHAVGGDRP